MLSLRPKVAELVFQLYGRALHPELFEICSSRTIRRGDFEVRLDITASGHVITWRYQGLTLTEVAASAQHPLPQKRRLFSYRLKGEKNDQVNCRGGMQYQVGFQLEKTDPEVFWAFQRELCNEAEHRGLLYRFSPGGRLALGALSYLHVEPRQRGLLVQAYHTFPDDYAVVKIQSLFHTP